MRIGVGWVGYFSNRTLLNMAFETFDSVTSDEHDLIFCGFLNHPVSAEWRAELDERSVVFDNDENNLSRGWNRSIDWLVAMDCDYVLVINTDIVLRAGALDALVRAASLQPDYLIWTMTQWQDKSSLNSVSPTDSWIPHPHFSAFMVDRRLFEIVGPFDEAIKPAYDEDIDMHWRVHIAGYRAMAYGGALFWHSGSATLRLDHRLREANTATHAANDRYFARKWNGKPATAEDAFLKHMFRAPFNDPAKLGFEARDYPPTW